VFSSSTDLAWKSHDKFSKWEAMILIHENTTQIRKTHIRNLISIQGSWIVLFSARFQNMESDTAKDATGATNINKLDISATWMQWKTSRRGFRHQNIGTNLNLALLAQAILGSQFWELTFVISPVLCAPYVRGCFTYGGLLGQTTWLLPYRLRKNTNTITRSLNWASMWPLICRNQ